MNKGQIFFIAIAALWCSAASAAPRDTTGLRDRLKAHVQYLASDEPRGRKAGSEDSRKAAEYICGEWERMGLPPVDSSYRHAFLRGGSNYVNLLAEIPGSGLRDEIVVIGAHYDHLGVKDGVIYPGADDNASGTAAVMEIARMLLAQKPSRTIYIAAFDGEELGLFGSNRLAEELDGRDIALMLSIDMVGWYKAGGSLSISGTGTMKDGEERIAAIAGRNGIKVKLKKFEDSIITATDTRGFAQKGKATLAVTTGLKSPYHKPQDTADKIDYNGLADICVFLADLVSEVASSSDYRPSGKVASIHRRRSAGLMLSLGFGSSHLDFGSNSAFVGKNGNAFRVGLEPSVALGRKLDLKIGAGVESAGFRIPGDGHPLASSEENHIYMIDVPVVLQWNILGSDGMEALFLNAGGYYSARLNHEASGLLRDGYGLQLGFGTEIGPLVVEWRYKIPATSLYAGETETFPAKTRLFRNYFCIGWKF